MQSKEKEIHGEWFTEDRLKKSGEFSAQLGFIDLSDQRGRYFRCDLRWLRESIRSIIQYCRRFPKSLTRPGGPASMCRVVTWTEHSHDQHLPLWRRWKYDASIEEYFVETITKAVVKQSELTRIREMMEREPQDSFHCNLN